jgi:hypothetical protein
LQLSPALEQAVPWLGMIAGQVEGPETLPQYHSGGPIMHAPPPGAHSEQLQTSPSGYPQGVVIPASSEHEDMLAGGLLGQAGESGAQAEWDASHVPPEQVTSWRHSARALSP